MSGMAGTLMQGMAFGGGSEVGHSVVRSLMGGSDHGSTQQPPPPPVQQQVQSQGGACQFQNQDLIACMQQNASNASVCQPYFDALKQCQESQGGAAF